MLYVQDDGTLDTVLECSECGKEIRYSDVERDEYGNLFEDWIKAEELSHDAHECGID